MANPKNENRIKWWNAPQYRGPINGFIGYITVQVLMLVYDLSGFDVEYRNYFLWAIGLIFASLVMIKAFNYRSGTKKIS